MTGGPEADRTPQVVGAVRCAVARYGVQPRLLAGIVGAEHRAVVVGVERRIVRHQVARLSLTVIRLTDLEQAEACAVVPDDAHVPPRLDRGDGPEQLRIEAPFVRGPLDDLVGRAGVMPGDVLGVRRQPLRVERPQLRSRRDRVVRRVVVGPRLP